MSQPTPKPWPLKWIALTIFICIGAYTIFTLLTLDNRKTARSSHEPWAEAQARKAHYERAIAAGYKLIGAQIERPASPEIAAEAISRFRATITPAPAGVPKEIAALYIGPPKLPDTFSFVAAPATASPKDPYQIVYTCQLPDERRLLAASAVYIKDDSIIIVTDFDNLSDDLLSRTTETTVLLTIPENTFASGHTYTMTLVGRNDSRQWSVFMQ